MLLDVEGKIFTEGSQIIIFSTHFPEGTCSELFFVMASKGKH